MGDDDVAPAGAHRVVLDLGGLVPRPRGAGVAEADPLEIVDCRRDSFESAVHRVVGRERAAVPPHGFEGVGDLRRRSEGGVVGRLFARRDDRNLQCAQGQVRSLDPRLDCLEQLRVVVALRRLRVMVDRQVQEDVPAGGDREARGGLRLLRPRGSRRRRAAGRA